MAEQKQLNIYQKLQKTRYELSKKEIKKSGKAIGKDGKVTVKAPSREDGGTAISVSYTHLTLPTTPYV